MRSNRIVILLDRLYKMDEYLGGNERKKKSKKPQKEFDSMVEELKEEIEMISAKQKDREQRNKKYGNDDEAIRQGVEIRDKIMKCDEQIKSLEKTLLRQLKKPQKYNQVDLEARVVAFKLTKIALKSTKTREFGIEEQEFQGVSLAQLQNNVFGQENNQSNYPQYQDQISQEEQDAMQRWNLNDEHMDQQLDNIISGLDQLHYKAALMGGKIDDTQKQIGGLIVEVDKASDQINNANKSLKKLIQVYRRPNKFCLDIAFIALLLGLIATIVTTVMK